MDILGGYKAYTLYQRFYIKPERRYIRTIEGQEVESIDPARIYKLEDVLIAAPSAMVNLTADVASVIPVAKGLSGLKGMTSQSK